MASTLDKDRLLSSRVKEIESSGIRNIWALAQSCIDPVDLSFGQPDFHVDESLKHAAIQAIENDRNGYTNTQGIDPLLKTVEARCTQQLGWEFGEQSKHKAMITTGTAGGLTLAFLTLLESGDEVIFADPYFVIYPALAKLVDAKAVYCSTYPDFRLTAGRIKACITERTKVVLLNMPSNPAGIVLNEQEVKEIAELCSERGIVLITDEIYDEFVYAPAVHATPAAFDDDVLMIRGFGKTYGCTGWRMGFAVGPSWLLDEMIKLNQQTFVCAPSVFQHALVHAYDVDLTPTIDRFKLRRDLVVDALQEVTEVQFPDGAFYAFPKVPSHLGLTSTEFATKCVEENVLVIPGKVFSQIDTHFRVSFSVEESRLERGLQILKSMMK